MNSGLCNKRHPILQPGVGGSTGAPSMWNCTVGVWLSATLATCECAGLLVTMSRGLPPGWTGLGRHPKECEWQEEKDVCLELWECSRQVTDGGRP